MSRGDFWTWQSAITSSDLEPVTRHVLLTLATFMNSQNTSAFPSQDTLAECTGLSKRTVVSHIKKAVEAGFLEVSKHGYGGQKWANNEYVAVMPSPKKVVHLTTKGSASDDIKVVQEMHSNTPSNTPSNTQDKNFTKNEEFKLKPPQAKPDDSELFEKVFKTLRSQFPRKASTRFIKSKSRDAFLKRLKGNKRKGQDPISAGRLCHALMHFYSEDDQRKENGEFVKSLHIVINNDMFEAFLSAGEYVSRAHAGAKVEKSDNDALWRSRAARYAVTGKFDPQWVKGSVHNVPKEIWKYFPEEDWVQIGFIKKDLS